MYDKLEEIDALILENEEKKDVIQKEKITTDNVYKVLLKFDTLLAVMEEVDKKRFCQLLIEKVMIRDEKSANGRWVKSLCFKLPVIENAIEISLDNNEHVEVVGLLERKGEPPPF